MSVVSRVLMAGLAAASLGVQAAPTVAWAQASAGGDDPSKPTHDRLLHASRCVVTLGFGCENGASASKDARKDPDKGAAKAGGEAKASKASVITGGDDQSAGTRNRFLHASKCVVSLGFAGHCDKEAPAAPARHADAAPAAPAAPDASTKGRLFQAAKCVTSFGLLGDCDKH